MKGNWGIPVFCFIVKKIHFLRRIEDALIFIGGHWCFGCFKTHYKKECLILLKPSMYLLALHVAESWPLILCALGFGCTCTRNLLLVALDNTEGYASEFTIFSTKEVLKRRMKIINWRQLNLISPSFNNEILVSFNDKIKRLSIIFWILNRIDKLNNSGVIFHMWVTLGLLYYFSHS